MAVFDEAMLRQSALDRFCHRAYQFVIDGESYRKRTAPGSGGKHPRIAVALLHLLETATAAQRADDYAPFAGGLSKRLDEPPHVDETHSARAQFEDCICGITRLRSLGSHPGRRLVP